MNQAEERGSMDFDCTGRVALITGAGSEHGIGFATARLLGAMGAKVFVTSSTDRCIERVEELRAAGIDAHGAAADLTVPEEVHALVRAVSDVFGRIDILVNNAGMTSIGDPMPSPAPTHTMTHHMWTHAIDRNLTTAFTTTAAVLPSMLQHRWGRIVNVASTTGTTGAMLGEAAYAAAKAGLVGFTKTVAIEYAAMGITANAVAPGWIATSSQTDHEVAQGSATPMGRSGTPEEVAHVIAALCTPGAAYLTGQCVVIDGGNSIAEERAR